MSTKDQIIKKWAEIITLLNDDPKIFDLRDKDALYALANYVMAVKDLEAKLNG